MQKSGAVYSLWRKMNLRRRKDSDLDNAASRADELLSNLENANSTIRELIRHNTELTKTFTQELKNMAADFERRSVEDRHAVEKAFESLQKEIEKKLYSIQREADENAGKLIAVAGKQGELLKQEQAIVGEKLDRACGAVANVDGSIKGIQDYLAEQNQVQRRYQEGYDFQILKNFVRQIIQMIINLDRRIEMTEEGEIKVDLMRVRDRLVDLLDRNGVVQIIPTVGSAFDAEMREIAEAAGVVDAPSPSFSGTVADVVQPGYLYTYTDDSEKSRCLQPAKVTIFEMGLDAHDPRRPPEENEEEKIESYKKDDHNSTDASGEIADDNFEDDSVESLRARMNDKLNDLFGRR